MKKPIWYSQLLLLVILIIGSNSWAATYQVTKGNQISTVIYQLQSEVTTSPDETWVTLSNEDGCSKLIFGNQRLKIWHYYNTNQNSDFIAARNSNVIAVKGVFKGKVIAKDFNIDNKYWYQAIDYAVTDFVKSGQLTRTFWILSEEELKLCQFVFKRGVSETIKVGENIYDTIRVRFTLPGTMAAFWGSDYWVRQSDGLLIKFQGLKGPPGSPKIIIELIED